MILAAKGTAPLGGILVITLEQAVAAPFCSSRLADAGARVIKIERPEGDFARRYDHVAKGESAYFVWLNRGKQSIALDIKDEADAAIDAVFRQLTRDQAVERLRRARVAFGSLNSVADLSVHRQLRRVEIDTPSGPVASVAPPVRWRGEDSVFGPVPTVDQHGAALRKEFES